MFDLIQQEAAHLAMKQACNGSSPEAVELYNWLSSDRAQNAKKEREFRRFQTEMKWGDYINAHSEARLMYIANEAAMAYVKENCEPGAYYRKVFELEARRICASMMAAEFVIEISAGNSWL